MKRQEFAQYLDALLFLVEVQDSGLSAYMLPGVTSGYVVFYR